MALYMSGELMRDPETYVGDMQRYCVQQATLLYDEEYRLKDKTLVTVSKADGILYVYKHEYAIVSADESCMFSKLGTDMAAASHMVVLYHKGAKVAALAHFDRRGTQEGVTDMINQTAKEVASKLKISSRSTIDLDLHIIGGYDDNFECLSKKISMELLDAIYHYLPKRGVPEANVHLLTFHASSWNNTKVSLSDNEKCDAPEIQGVICDAESGVVLPALFEDDARTPAPLIRGVKALTEVDFFPNVFNTKDNHFVLHSFSYPEQFGDVTILLEMEDNELKKRFSKCPKLETKQFCDAVREQLQFVYDHREPSETVFLDQEALYFKAENSDRTAEIVWKQLKFETDTPIEKRHCCVTL